MLNLDTHILVYALSDELRPRERKLLSGAKWTISAIVLWELAKLVQLPLGVEPEERAEKAFRQLPSDLYVIAAAKRYGVMDVIPPVVLPHRNP